MIAEKEVGYLLFSSDHPDAEATGTRVRVSVAGSTDTCGSESYSGYANACALPLLPLLCLPSPLVSLFNYTVLRSTMVQIVISYDNYQVHTMIFRDV